jgi:hypothetical protein
MFYTSVHRNRGLKNIYIYDEDFENSTYFKMQPKYIRVCCVIALRYVDVL